MLQNGQLLVDHLVRVSSDSKWKYPSHEDLQEVGPEQIVPCEVLGEWDMAPNSRERLFSVTNIKAISHAYEFK